MSETINATVNRWAKQLAEPNSYPPEVFMPLVAAVLEKAGLVAVERKALEQALVVGKKALSV